MSNDWKSLVTTITVKDNRGPKDKQGRACLIKCDMPFGLTLFDEIISTSFKNEIKEFSGERSVYVMVEDPKMHTFNLSNSYCFHWNKDENTFHLTSPLETHILGSLAFREMISELTCIFVDLFQATS